MAKNPKRGLSDEDIVRLRDDAAYPGRAQALGSPEARRALAESRLRALAISLTGTGAAQTDDRMLNDDELLEYLLADMAEDRRRGLESRLRGNPRAFARLVKLHELTSAQVNHRDLQHVDMPERKIERHDLGKFDVRIRAGRLAFRRVDEGPARLAELSQMSLRELRMPNLMASVVRDFEDDDTLGQIEHLLFRCRDLAAQVRQLRDEGDGWDPDDLASLKRIGRLPAAEEELADTIRRLQHLGQNLAREAMISRKRGLSPKAPLRPVGSSFAEYRAPPLSKGKMPVRRSTPLESDWGGEWQERVEILAGPWTMSLAGKARPASMLEVSIVSRATAAPAERPFLTIVQPGKTFETASFDSSGNAELPLLGQRNILMLQEAALWAVHLNLSSSG